MPAFHVSDLSGNEERVRSHFSLPHVRYAGSHTKCGCGFNEGREYPQAYDDPSKERATALVSSALLARYIREHHVEQIYSCWSGEEDLPQEFERHITPDTLMDENFFFRQKELLNIDRRSG